MYNKEHLKNNKFLFYKLPLCAIWAYYILKVKKFPYFMYYSDYRRERLVKQGLGILLGCFTINLGFNILQIVGNQEE